LNISRPRAAMPDGDGDGKAKTNGSSGHLVRGGAA
jgi:hypothetical protein